jgi:hypothetical protein
MDELTSNETALLLGVTRARVMGMVRQGQLVPRWVMNEHRRAMEARYDRAQVEHLAAERAAIAAGTAEKKRPGPKPRAPRKGEPSDAAPEIQRPARGGSNAGVPAPKVQTPNPAEG